VLNSRTAPLRATRAIRGRLSLHPLFRDFGLTAVTELGVLVSGLAIVSLMGRLLGVIALGEYLLLRRVLAWLQPAVQLGMGNALPRYVAYHADGHPAQLRRYLAVSLVLSGGLAALLALLLYLGRNQFAGWLFGSAHLQTLILPLGLMTLGLTIHGSAYGYFRGRLALIQANALQACNVVFVPLIVVIGLAKTHSVGLIVGATGLVTVIFSMLTSAFLLYRGTGLEDQLSLRDSAGELLRYGVPRVPGDFALGALLALGPLVAMHFVSISNVTCLLLGISILSAVNASSTPVGALMLSKVSMMLVQGRRDAVRTYLQYFLAAVIELAIFVCLQLVVLTPVLLHAWVGRDFGAEALVAQIIMLAIPFYLIYGCLRGSVDAASITAYNTHNLFLALGLFGVLLVTAVNLVPHGLLPPAVAASLLLSLIFLAGLTLRTTRQLFGLTVPWRQIAPGVGVGAVLACATALAQLAMGARGTIAPLLLGAPATVVFLLTLKVIGTPWVPFFIRLALRRPASGLAGRPPHGARDLVLSSRPELNEGL
jgi:O-antigen/teichoic acid export membrane protein